MVQAARPLAVDVNIPIKSIRRDGGTQPRVAINQTTVEEYASDMKEGASFPPVLLFFDSTDYWLADGYHRVDRMESGVSGLTLLLPKPVGWQKVLCESLKKNLTSHSAM